MTVNTAMMQLRHPPRRIPSSLIIEVVVVTVSTWVAAMLTLM